MFSEEFLSIVVYILIFTIKKLYMCSDTLGNVSSDDENEFFREENALY